MKIAHVAALLLVAVTVMLLITPAAYHRIVFAGEDPEEVQRIGSWTVTLSTVPLRAALALDTYVVSSQALKSSLSAGCIAGAVFVGLAAAWLGYPLLARRKDRGRETARDAKSR